MAHAGAPTASLLDLVAAIAKLPTAEKAALAEWLRRDLERGAQRRREASAER